MARNKTGGTRAPSNRGTGYVGQNDSRAYYNRLAQQGVQQNNPAGTAYLLGSNNLGYGVVGAYDANNNFLGFVRGNLGDGVRVNYGADGSAAGIQMPTKPSSLIAPNVGGVIGAPGGDNGKSKFDFASPDSQHQTALAILAENRDRALNAANAGEKSTAYNYGLGITQDDNGATFSGQWAGSDPNQGGIDPSNPFSRASLLNKSYFTAGKVGEGSYANRGMLTSGAYQRNQGRDAFRFESGKDSLLKDFASQLQAYRQQRADARSTYGTGVIGANTDLYNRNVDLYNRTYPS